MATDADDARLFGNVEARLAALEAHVIQIDANHRETMAALYAMRTILDRQEGGIKVLRWIGASVLAASGWATWALGVWPRRGR